MEKIVINKGVTLHIVPTEKFKNITISIKLKNKLTKETSTIRTLLSFVFSGGTKKLPNQQALSKHLENLYGMQLSCSISSKGKAHIINLSSVCINDEYLPEKEDLLKQQLSLLHDIIFELNNDGKAIDETIFNLRKRELKQRLASNKNDKYSYSIEELLKNMGEGQTLGISSTGYEEELDQITKEELYEYYQKCLKEDTIDIYVIGNIKEEDLDLFKSYLSFEERNNTLDSIAYYKKQRQKVLEIEEIQDISQAKLNIGYAIDTNFLDQDHYAFTVFNGMFGGFSHSKLFKVVREEHSLCYYISSSYDAFNSIMVVSAGIDASQNNKVQKIISEQLELFKNGDISIEDLAITKAMLIDGLKKSDDEAGNMIALKYNRDIVGKKETIEEYIERLNNVSIEDIQKVANKVNLDTTFVLKGRGE